MPSQLSAALRETEHPHLLQAKRIVLGVSARRAGEVAKVRSCDGFWRIACAATLGADASQKRRGLTMTTVLPSQCSKVRTRCSWSWSMLARSDGGDESLAQNQAIQAAPLSARFVPAIGTGVARVTPRVPSGASQAHDAAWPPSPPID